MSVINETLDNLKKPKKKPAAALSPASSAFYVAAETKPLSDTTKSYIIPAACAIFIGVFFMLYQMNPTFFKAKRQANQDASLFAQAKTAPKKYSADKVLAVNPQVQGQYYTALNLLNEGKEEQALQSLKEIVTEHPEFSPAQKVYSMLTVH